MWVFQNITLHRATNSQVKTRFAFQFVERNDNCFTLARVTQYLFSYRNNHQVAMQALGFLSTLTEATRAIFAFKAGAQHPFLR